MYILKYQGIKFFMLLHFIDLINFIDLILSIQMKFGLYSVKSSYSRYFYKITRLHECLCFL